MDVESGIEWVDFGGGTGGGGDGQDWGWVWGILRYVAFTLQACVSESSISGRVDTLVLG